ncbi:MAG: hypothetical protein ACJ76S_04095 [Solirubrobacteraceae bacterium]
MPTAETRRTLVKSAPELWAELSDAEALGRRLESLGEIRITRLEPHTTVAWEGERARGTVRIEPSGFGTRVTLTAESSEPPPPPVGPEPSGPDLSTAPEPWLGPRPSTAAAPEPRPESPEPALAPAVVSAAASARPDPLPEPEEPLDEPAPPSAARGGGFGIPAPRPPSRRSFGRTWLDRFLNRRPTTGAESPEPTGPAESPEPPGPAEPEPPLAESPEPPGSAEPEPAPVEPAPMPAPEPPASEPPEPRPPLDPAAGEPAAVGEPEEARRSGAEALGPEVKADPVAVDHEPEAEPAAVDDEPEADPRSLDAEALDEVLSAVLDDLGAAHHRPFSRG